MTAPVLAMTVGLTVGAVSVAAPAQAEPIDTTFVNAIENVGLNFDNPQTAMDLGRQACDSLSQPGQNAADVAAKIADSTGFSLGGASMFTGIAISMLCPAVVGAINTGQMPSLPIPGF